MENIINQYSILQLNILGNLLVDWLFALIVVIVSWLVLKIFKTIIISRLKAFFKKTKNDIDDLMIGAIETIHWPFYFFMSIYIGSYFVVLPNMINKILYYILLVSFIYYAVRFAESLINYGTKIIIEKKKGKQDGVGIINFMSSLLKVSLWVLAVILLLSNMGYNVTSLIAGLGVGGIAVALALQNILGDLFSSLTIYFDKPFQIGDFVVVGDQMGTVTKVGIKTTRIQVPQGEELVVANSNLTNTQIRNFGVMKRRRVVFNIGVSYDTDYKKLKEIPEIIKRIIESQNKTEVDRIHFKSFGDFALIFEIVFYINSGEYIDYMNTQQEINLEIINKFAKENIEIAFPTQTIYLKK